VSAAAVGAADAGDRVRRQQRVAVDAGGASEQGDQLGGGVVDAADDVAVGISGAQ